MSEHETHPARLTLDEFQALTVAWRTRARDGDLTTCLIADALESVLRRRIARAQAQQRAAEIQNSPHAWWKLWER